MHVIYIKNITFENLTPNSTRFATVAFLIKLSCYSRDIEIPQAYEHDATWRTGLTLNASRKYTAKADIDIKHSI